MTKKTKSDSRSLFDDFVGLYPVAKTLRFELRPVAATRAHINKLDLLSADKSRAEYYKTAKPYIDEYYKYIIDQVLSGSACRQIDWKPLAEAIRNLRKDSNETTRKALKDAQKEYRTMFANAFKVNELLKQVDKKELFTKLLPEFEEKHPATEEQREAYMAFQKFSVYFTGFHENRRNIFAADKEGVSIPWRIVNENFPKFLTNIDTFALLQEQCPEELKTLEEELTETLKEKLPETLKGSWLKTVFSLDFYGEILTQKGIDLYNTILGGQSVKLAQVKTKGVNETINLYRQAHPGNRLPLMSPLYKQILSDRESYSFSYDVFPDDASLVDALKNFQKETKSVIQDLPRLFARIRKFDLSKIYVPESEVTKISHALFGNWSYIRDLIADEANRLAEPLKTKKEKDKQIGKLVKADCYSLEFIEELIHNAPELADNSDNNSEGRANASPRTRSALPYWTTEIPEIGRKIAEAYKELAQVVFVKEYSTTRPLRSQEKDVEIVKNYLDAVQELLHRCKSVSVPAEMDRDPDWYSQLDPLYESLSGVIPLYNLVRATVTKKVNMVEMYKLNFENPTLCNGWDENKEQDNTCIMLQKDGLYYLGILNAKDKPKTASLSDRQGGPFYQKMVYKLLPGPNKMLPKVFFSEKGLKTFNPPKAILDGYKAGRHKKGAVFSLDFCRKLIDYFKSAIASHPDWSKFPFQFSDTSSYEDISGFYREVEQQGYMINFRNVSASQIDEWVEKGKLFLFQIYNKDFAPGAPKDRVYRKNLHTLYWEQLFSPENLADVVSKLDGEAELFYRPAAHDQHIVHKVGQKFVNRRLKDNRTIVPEKIYTELFRYYNGKLKEKDLSSEALKWKDRVTVKDVKHEIVKDRRYTREQFQIHIKTRTNFKSTGVANYNFKVLRALKDNPDVNIIGLDRGERNLIYLTVIDQKGVIRCQKSLNIVGKDWQETNYQEKLNDRESQRDEARKSWKSIGAIKELKEGYLSQAIHEIVSLMLKYNAIIVMENLNIGFKRGRFKVEKQVYQKFEKALIDKLSYLTFKDRTPGQPGSVLNGFQLTPPDVQMTKVGNQCGFLFYVPAGYTSKIDPTTGFVNQLRFNDRIEPSRKLYQKMSAIQYNRKADYFEFSFDYREMIKQDKPQSLEWTVCTHGNKRINKYRDRTAGVWLTEDIDVTAKLKALFKKFGIDYQSGNDLRSAIAERTEGAFFKTLNWLLKLTLQLRYSDSQTGEDYILSPVRNAAGKFFLSDGDTNGKLPADADANGAYNIALKGLWLLQQGIGIEGEKIVLKKISNADWFQFARERNEKK